MAASYLPQTILPTHIAPSQLRLRKLTPRTCDVLSKYVLENGPAVLGVAVRLASNGAVNAVAFATSAEVFFVDIASTSAGLSTDASTSRGSKVSVIPNNYNYNSNSQYTNTKSTCGLDGLLHNPRCMLAGFGMARIALHLHRQCGLAVRGVDLGSVFPRMKNAAEFVAGKVHQDAPKYRIHALWCHQQVHDVCLRAWISAVCAEGATATIEYCLKVDTNNVQGVELRVLGELLMNVELLEAEKPTQMDNEFENVEVDSDGQIVIRNARFNTRVRASNQTAIVMETTHGQSVVGKAVSVYGKQTGVKVVGGSFRGGGIERIRVVGREESTNSEVARDEFILQLLQGSISSLTESQFVEMLWFSSNTPQQPYFSTAPYAYYDSFSKLNPSQKEVVGAMWSPYEPLVVVQGPPGTGKTTTIAVALDEWDSSGSPVWVIAQSNVGVKNIARSLVKYDIDFKILVSKEFYIEWHEHLYESIQHRLIRSDELIADPVDVEHRIGGATTILCTAAMLSNPALDKCAVFRLVPVERLIVDEVSQIDSFEFMHLFHKFRSLKKVCMFGDPKQLPPYGKETAPSMKTIFDFKQIKPSAYFLNTQYRMPTPLGDFISAEIYNSKLESVHDITDGSCVRFVDVRKGLEASAGSSFTNHEEVNAVVTLVKNYYQRLDFCIITPYDGQRAAITQRLKAEDLTWERVYNVDSFQGHEAPYVIISTVRTSSPGFLKSLNRMNVMLTRCQSGMVVVTNQSFLTNSGRDTLLGKLAQQWRKWGDSWIDPLALSDRSARLPGIPGLGSTSTTLSVHPGARASTTVAQRVVPGAWPGARTSLSSPGSVNDAPRRQRNHSSPAAAVARPIGTTTPRFATPDVRTFYRDASSPSQSQSSGSPRTPSFAPADPDVLNVAEQMGRLWTGGRVTQRENLADAEDLFPALGDVAPVAKPALKGKWVAGSQACKLHR